MSNKVLIGSVVERKTSTWSNPPKPSAQTNLGFPSAQHRSKSAFARNKEKQRNHGAARLRNVPNIVSAPGQEANPDDWREQMGSENQRRVEAMTEEEREEEKKQIYERFGPEIGSILKRAKERVASKREPEPKSIPASDTRRTHYVCLPQGFLY